MRRRSPTSSTPLNSSPPTSPRSLCTAASRASSRATRRRCRVSIGRSRSSRRRRCARRARQYPLRDEVLCRGAYRLRSRPAVRPDAAPIHNNMRQRVARVGRHEDALASFDRALALDPDYADAHNNRGNAYLELNRPGDALAGYDRALALKPDSPTRWSIAAMRCAISAASMRRSQSFDRALALEPELADAHWNKALLAAVARRFDARLARNMNGAGSAKARRSRAISPNRNGAAKISPAKPSCCTPSKASATPSSSCATCRWWRQRRPGGARNAGQPDRRCVGPRRGSWPW